MSLVKILEIGRVRRVVLIPLTFGALMLIGACLLMLPLSQTGTREISFLNALFLSVSTVSVTGMSMFDIGRDFSIFGQLVILALMQVGGLGVMTVMVLIGIYTGRKIQLRERLLISESFSLQSPSGMVFLVKKIIIVSSVVEFVSGTLLAFWFAPLYGWKGVYFGYWHAVAAFTNSGMALFGGDRVMMVLSETPFVSTVIVLTMFLGGVGFMVIDDCLEKRKWSRLTLNTKLVLTMEMILIPFGATVYFLLEGHNPGTLGGLDAVSKWETAFFMSVSSRLAGFTMFEASSLTGATTLFLMLFMFIGGAPVSTGSGIRTTTLGVLFLSLLAWMRGRRDIVVFHKRVDSKCVTRASNVFTLEITLTFLTAFFLFVCAEPSFRFEDVLFEAVAAFSTVGITMGLIDDWNTAGQIVLMTAMFLGRIGVMTLALLFMERSRKPVSYPDENIIIG